MAVALSVWIKKKLGNFNLDISFEAEHEILALLGASGCGKSMTLKCIAGIETPDEGRIILDGKVLFDSRKKINLPPQKRKVGYLFQNYALFPHMTVWQNVAAGVRTGRKQQRKQMVAERIKALYLEGLEEKYPFQLSGGQQQRVALARILANEPDMIMLDEPFSALDSYLKWQLEQELTDTLSSFHGTTLFVSHDRDEVFRICEKVVIIDTGLSQPKTSVSDLFDHPTTLSGAILTGCKNYSRIQIRPDGYIEALDWGVALRCEDPVSEDIRYAGVRAHYIVPFEPPKSGGENVLHCRVLRVTQDLFSTIYMLRGTQSPGDSDFSDIRMELPKEDAVPWQVGDTVSIQIDRANILLLK
ncbi:MAG: ATP-binding cassette domain-containing protein [Oscillospiraceae bacterium]|nr:ATP-binding cassette domain-containing protein [Oscillospiraceae bacterium]